MNSEGELDFGAPDSEDMSDELDAGAPDLWDLEDSSPIEPKLEIWGGDDWAAETQDEELDFDFDHVWHAGGFADEEENDGAPADETISLSPADLEFWREESSRTEPSPKAESEEKLRDLFSPLAGFYEELAASEAEENGSPDAELPFSEEALEALDLDALFPEEAAASDDQSAEGAGLRGGDRPVITHEEIAELDWSDLLRRLQDEA